jgi:hypothetical protein
LLTDFGSAEPYEFFFEKFAETARRRLLSAFPWNALPISILAGIEGGS